MINVGSVAVDVVGDVSRFGSRLRSDLLPEADRVGREIGKSLADSIAKGIKQGLGGGFTGAPAESSRKGAESGGAFADAFRSKLEAALKALPSVKIDADSSPADRKIAELRARLLELSGQRVGIDISESDAKAKIASIREDLVRLGNSSPSVQVRMDAAKAVLELAALQAEIKKVDGKRVKIDADADTAGATTKLAALGSAASGAAGGFSPLVLAGLALGPAIIPVAAAAVAAIAAIGTAAVGAGAGFGVAFIALKPIIGAVQALGAADASAATDAAAAATAAKAKANAIASGNAQVASSEASLSNARESAASAAVNAADRVKTSETALRNTRDTVAAAAVTADQRVADARRSLADAQTQAAQGVQTALGQVTSAERTLAQAQQSELAAQQALTDARKSAAQQLQDYQTQLADGALSQRAALLAIQRAQENLNKVNASGASTQLQRDEAKLAYDQAVQHNTDLGIQQQRLKASAAAANAAGVEGSRQVVAAKDRVSQANQNISTAQDALAKVEAGVAAARAKGDEQVAKAQEAVATAQRAQVEQQRQGAAQIVAAQQAVESSQRAQADQARQGAASIAAAQESVANAQRALAAAYDQTSSAGVSSADKVAKAFAGLTPAGASFARFIYGLKDSFKGLSEAAQNGLLPGLQTAIQGLLPALPGLTKFVGDLAKVMGDLFVQASKALTGPFWTQFFSFIGGSAAGWLKTFAETFGNLVKGAAGLFQALAPVGDLFNTSLLKGSKSFADWAANLSTNTGFQKFLGYIKDNLPAVKDLLTDAGKAFGNIIVALAPFGPKIVDGLDRLLKLVADTDPKKLGEAVAGLTGLAAAAKTLGPTLDVLDSAFAKSKIGRITEALLALGAAAAYAYEKWPAFKKIADEAGQTLDSLGKDSTGKGLGTNVFDLFVQRLTDTGTQIRAKVYEINDMIRDKILSVNDAIRDKIIAVNDAIVGKIYAVNDAIRGKIYEVNDAIRDKILTVNDAIRDRILSVNDAIRDKIFGVNDAIRDYLLARWSDISRNATDWWNGIVGSISRIWDGFLDWLHGKLSGLGSFLSGAWADIRRNASDWWNGITAGISGIWDGFTRWIGEKVGGLGTFLSGAWSGIKSGSDAMWGQIVGGIGSIWDTVVDKIKGPLNTILGFIEDHFVKPLNAMLGAVGIDPNAFKIPDIPQFAAGGLASIPTGAARHAAGGAVDGWSPHDRADNIPAWLTAREWVQPVDAVDYYGTGVMEALQHKLIPRGLFAGEGHADGGLVRGYADGGSVWDAIKTGARVGAGLTPVGSAVNAVGDVGSFLADPVGKFKELVGQLLSGVGSGVFPEIAKGGLGKVGDGLGAKVQSLLAAMSQQGGATAAAGDAVSYAMAQINSGTTGWLNRCLAFVNAAWGNKVPWLGSPRAIDSWNAAPGKHPGDASPPAGAALYYTTGNPAGHVDLSLGGNSIASTDLPTRDKVGKVDFSTPMSQWGAKYLGWAIPAAGIGAAGGVPTSGQGSAAFEGWWSQSVAVNRALAPFHAAATITARNESGFNPSIFNRTDSNAQKGTPSAGLMQFIESTFRANAWPGYNNWMGAVDQILAWKTYADRRYGGPNSLPGVRGTAAGTGYAPYAEGGPVLKPILMDTGGFIPQGLSVVDNQTGGREHLTRTDQFSGPVVVTVIDRDGSFVDRMRGEIARADRASQLVAAAGSSVAIR